MKRWRKLRWLVWLVLPLVIGWVLSRAPLVEIWSVLRQLSPARLAALAIVDLLITGLFSSRWWLILRAMGYRLPYLDLARYRLAGFSISYFTPGTQFGGEPLQIYMLQKRHQVPGPVAMASVTLDKLFELLTNFTFLAVGLLVIVNGGLFEEISGPQTLVWVGVLFCLPPVYLLSLWAGRAPVAWLSRAGMYLFPRWMGWVKTINWITTAESEVSSLIRRKPAVMVVALLVSGGLWLLSIAEYWLSVRFLGPALTLSQTVSSLAAARLAFLTPLPAGVGALEASQVLAMEALGLGAALGASISLLIRARDLSLGLLGLWWGARLTQHHPVIPLPSQAGETTESI